MARTPTVYRIIRNISHEKVSWFNVPVASILAGNTDISELRPGTAAVRNRISGNSRHR
jgi:hypothetical protein